MSQTIQACSVLLAALWFWCWSGGVFLVALFSNADIGLVILVSLVVWAIGLLAMWWALFRLADLLDRGFGRGEKKKKRPPIEQSLS